MITAFQNIYYPLGTGQDIMKDAEQAGLQVHREISSTAGKQRADTYGASMSNKDLKAGGP